MKRKFSIYLTEIYCNILSVFTDIFGQQFNESLLKYFFQIKIDFKLLNSSVAVN